MEIKTFTAKDGKTVYYREWTAENPKGLVQISHGMAEGIVRYESLAEFFRDNGYTVFGDDHRAHGKTDGNSGYSDGDIFNDTLSDMATLSDIFKERYKGLKLVLFGHSYGSFLTQAFMEKYSDKADGYILCGSAFMKNFAVFSGGIVAKLGCLFGKSKKPAELIAKLSFGAYNSKYKDGTAFISSIKEECDKYYACPDCGFVLSYAFYRSMFSALPKMYSAKSAHGINADKPLFILSGKEDPVGGYGKLTRKLADFYRKAGVKNLSVVLYDGVRHECLNDVSREKAKADLLAFVNGVTQG